MRAVRFDRVCRVYVDRPGTDFAPPTNGVRARVDGTTGFLHVRDVNIARSGLLAYTDGQSIWNELRTDAELTKAAPSFSNNVFTNTHPAEMVTTSNVAKVQAGTVGNVTVQGKFLVADEIIITDRASIDRASEPGGWELSIGFFADVVPSSRSIVDGEQVRFEQKALEGNHTAGVEQGRAGPDCRLPGMDSACSVVALADSFTQQTNHQPASAEDTPMPDEKKADAPEPKQDTAVETTPPATPEAAAPVAPVESQPVAVVDTAKIVRERVSLIRAADAVLDSVDDTADDRTIRLAVVAKVYGADAIASADGWSDDRLAGEFSGAIRSHKSQPKIDTASQIQRMTGHAADGHKVEKIDLNEIHAQMAKELRDAHRKPAAHQEARSA